MSWVDILRDKGRKRVGNWEGFGGLNGLRSMVFVVEMRRVLIFLMEAGF